MWKTVNSVYKSANKNIKKLGKSITNMPSVSQSIQKIKLNNILPKVQKKEQSELQKTINSIFNNKKPVMPINKMSLIAELSYDNENFDRICDLILQNIRVFKYQTKYAKKTLNTLILLCYLIKNAPSGFVDQFRAEIPIFQQHSQLSLQNAYINDDKQIEKLKPLLTEIRERAKYITALLTDKKKLLKQKQIAMEIKKKIIQGINKENIQQSNENSDLIVHLGNSYSQSNQKKSLTEKVDSFLEHYVWTYWNKFDQKMQNITEKIIQKIDQYLDLEEPESFSIEQIEIEQKQEEKTENDSEEDVKRKEQIFLKEKNELDIQIKGEKSQGPVLNTDLI